LRCGRFTAAETEKKAPAPDAQGIEAEIPQTLPQVKSRNWSGKPGFRRGAPEMRPKQNGKRDAVLFLEERSGQTCWKKSGSMKDWIAKLDDFMKLSGGEILAHAGRISAETAKLKAGREYDKFKERPQYNLTPVEQHFLESLEQAEKKLSWSTK
jgi:hypothetical protein